MKYLKIAKSLTKYRLPLRTKPVNPPQVAKVYWLQLHHSIDLTTFKKAEAIHATPQDLSTVLRWA